MGSSTLLPLPSNNCSILFAASGTAFINFGIIEIIEETNKGLILLPLICKWLLFLITSVSIFFPWAICSSALFCLCCSFACLLLITTEAAVPAANNRAEMPAITKETSASN